MIDPNAYQWLQIEPVDAWFFRDGRPSNRGEDQSDVVSEFPPNPRTIVGAIRAALARERGWNGRGQWCDAQKQVLGDGDDLGLLSFLGPFMMRANQLLWPLPQHVVGINADGNFEPTALLQPSDELMVCDVNSSRAACLPVVPHCTDATREYSKPPGHPDGIYVTSTGLARILAGDPPAAAECVHQKKLFVHESRTGLRRNPETRTTERNDLYSPRYVRLIPGVSLVHGIAGLRSDWPIPKLMTLGGESRMAGVEALSPAPTFPEATTAGPQTLIALTAAIFADDWWGAGPGDSASKLSVDLSGKVATAAVDRPQLIGGWSFQTGPLPLRPYARAGSVWWLEERPAKGGLLQVGGSTTCGDGLCVMNGSS